jgi:hypothetical protein
MSFIGRRFSGKNLFLTRLSHTAASPSNRQATLPSIMSPAKQYDAKTPHLNLGKNDGSFNIEKYDVV